MTNKKADILLRIRNRIYAGYYWPREQMVETRLAEEMRVSRTVIRDILKELEVKGLVTIIPNRGAFVAELSYDKMKEILELEAILEGSAAYLATPRLGTEQIEALDHLLQKSKNLPLDAIQAWAKYNWEFHRTILTACGNGKLIKIVRHNVRFVKYWFVQLSIPEEIAQRNLGHEEIISMIKKRNAARVRELMEAHLMFAAEDLIKRIQSTAPNLIRSERVRGQAPSLVEARRA